jgi:acetoacetyl-CoA synthetase
MSTSSSLWSPSLHAVATAPMTAFCREAEKRHGRDLPDYRALHRWSVDEPEEFWSLIWDFCEVVGERGERILVDGDSMPGARFFPDARLNFAENLLRKRGSTDALVFRGEDKIERRVSWDQLHAQVSRLQQAFSDAGLKAGDRVAAMMPNMPEAVAAMLAATSLGAIWTSCSPDFGEQGVLDRFGQIEPVILIAPDGYWYNGKRIDVGAKVAAVLGRLPSVRRAVIVDYLGSAGDIAAGNARMATWDGFIAAFEARDVTYRRMPFAHPLFILYSSGTTGVPKCIVHCAGGILLQELKEQRLHCGVVEGDRFFYFTTLGWMMWNWLVGALASGATLMLYDGSPLYPEARTLFDYAEAERMTYFGTSAKFIDSARKAGLRPRDTHDLSTVRLISSTGSPLSPESFAYVYDAVKPDVHLASVSGGTDICACFVNGLPSEPVWAGEIQGPALGMAVDVWNDAGQPVKEEKGELVCTRPFPSMPVMFWNDPDGTKYHNAYFARFPGVWCHGDYAEWTGHGGMIIHGRSDATLNPGGVRIGTAEIYNQVEGMPEILEAISIGQNWEGDVRVVLFVRLAEGVMLDDEMEKRIRARIRAGATPRHVPARIAVVTDIPRTKSGKITELAVRDAVHGRPVNNVEALANPEALDQFRGRAELAT